MTAAAARALGALLDGTDDGGVASDADRALLAGAVANLRRGGEAALEAATPHLWAYYRATAETVGTGPGGVPDIRDPDLGDPDLGDDVWAHVELPRPPVFARGGRPLAPSPCYLVVEGECAWEPEHGLQLVFDHAGDVCRIDAYDGHPTLAEAWGDAALLGVVYRAPG